MMDNLHPNVFICTAQNNGKYVRRSAVVMTIASQCADLGKPNKQYSSSLREALTVHYEWVQLHSASTLLKILFSSRVCPVITMGALCESAVCTCVVCMLLSFALSSVAALPYFSCCHLPRGTRPRGSGHSDVLSVTTSAHSGFMEFTFVFRVRLG